MSTAIYIDFLYLTHTRGWQTVLRVVMLFILTNKINTYIHTARGSETLHRLLRCHFAGVPEASLHSRSDRQDRRGHRGARQLRPRSFHTGRCLDRSECLLSSTGSTAGSRGCTGQYTKKSLCESLLSVLNGLAKNYKPLTRIYNFKEYNFGV